MSTPRLVIATHNAKKLDELRRILAERMDGFDPASVVSAADLDLPDVLEDGVTFAENALKKARACAAATGLAAVADDSGLAVDVLGGSPGIFSARWSGRHGDDEANNDLLLAQLGDVPDGHRGARFVCAAALVAPASEDRAQIEEVEIAEMPGSVLRERHGAGGFGYDPLFLPAGQSRSAAELSPAEKDAISHRGQALRALAPRILAVLG